MDRNVMMKYAEKYIEPILPENFERISTYDAAFDWGLLTITEILYSNGKIGFVLSFCERHQTIRCGIYRYPFDMVKADDGNLYASKLYSIELDDLSMLHDGSTDSLLLGDFCAKNSTDGWRIRKRKKLIEEKTDEVFQNIASEIQRLMMCYLDGSKEPDFEMWSKYRSERIDASIYPVKS